MGLFRVLVEATGGHGCQREVKDGGKVFGCRRMDCPDCLTQEFVEKMNKIAPVSKAEFIHWPNAAEWNGQTITDEIVPARPQISSWTNTDGTTGQTAYVEPGYRIRHGNF